MGYPTDVRVHSDTEAAGINQLWGSSGTPLTTDETRTVVNVTSKAGKVLAARLFSKSPNVWLSVAVDGDDILEPLNYFQTGYSCIGKGMLSVVRKYDTVNNQYIIELAMPVEFGDSLLVRLVNWVGAAVNAFSHIIWAENT